MGQLAPFALCARMFCWARPTLATTGHDNLQMRLPSLSSLPLCTSWVAGRDWFHWAVQQLLQLQSAAEHGHKQYTFPQTWKLVLSSLLSKLVHEILSQRAKLARCLLERTLPRWKPRECGGSSGPAVRQFA